MVLVYRYLNTLTYQNSYYNRTPRIFNSLPPNIRGSYVTIGQFKSYLLKYYHKMTKLVYVARCPVLQIKCVVSRFLLNFTFLAFVDRN